jgi:hypothetical protein
VLHDSLKTETILAHSDNLVAIWRVHPTINRIYKCEVITKNILAGNKQTAILLSSNWVNHHYEGEYLARLQKLLDTDGFVDIQNPYANPTRKIRNAVYDFQHKLHDKYVSTNPPGHL